MILYYLSDPSTERRLFGPFATLERARNAKTIIDEHEGVATVVTESLDDAEAERRRETTMRMKGYFERPYCFRCGEDSRLCDCLVDDLRREELIE